MKMRVINFSQWERESVVRFFFLLGAATAFLGSMTPWFFWPVADKFPVISSVFLLFSMGVANMMSERFYPRTDFLPALLAYALLTFYQIFTQGQNINAYIIRIFYIISFYAFFRVKLEELKRFFDILAKGMGGFLIVSMFSFLLYLIGFPLPSTDASYADLYSFTNYYLFLIDDRSLFIIIPRFQSIFVEPGHLGTMLVMILFTQVGKWKRWYNVSMIIAMLISFSLAAYGLFVGVVFLGLWVRGRQFIKKTLYAIALFAIITAGSFYYNGGDNLLHDLIILRLEVDDGEMAGDNRVTDDFKADYESLLQSSDVLFGRERNKEAFGNSGFRVFIYDYGLVGVALLVLFYLISLFNPENKKAVTAVLIIALLNFIIRANSLLYANFIPLYYIAKYNLAFEDNES